MALARNDVHDGVCGIADGREIEAKALEVGLNFSFGALIDDTTFAEEEKRVEGFEDLGSRLMDDGNDGDVEPREFFQCHHDGRGRRCVQAAGGLVEEESHGSCGQFDADTDPFPLTP